MPWAEIDLDDVSDEELTQEYEARGLDLAPGQTSRTEIEQAIREIYYLRRQGKPFEHELNKLICDTLGVVA